MPIEKQSGDTAVAERETGEAKKDIETVGRYKVEGEKQLGLVDTVATLEVGDGGNLKADEIKDVGKLKLESGSNCEAKKIDTAFSRGAENSSLRADAADTLVYNGAEGSELSIGEATDCVIRTEGTLDIKNVDGGVIREKGAGKDLEIDEFKNAVFFKESGNVKIGKTEECVTKTGGNLEVGEASWSQLRTKDENASVGIEKMSDSTLRVAKGSEVNVKEARDSVLNLSREDIKAQVESADGVAVSVGAGSEVTITDAKGCMFVVSEGGKVEITGEDQDNVYAASFSEAAEKMKGLLASKREMRKQEMAEEYETDLEAMKKEKEDDLKKELDSL